MSLHPFTFSGRIQKQWKRYWEYYIMLLPALFLLLAFKYLPMWGIQIAFRDFNIFDGISSGKWIGFFQFERLFTSDEFYQVLFNTCIISFYKIIFLFPMGVIIALVLNEIRCNIFKRLTQTLIYIPHFLSWVVIFGLFTSILSSNGIFNKLVTALGGEAVSYMVSPRWFRTILVFTAGWKECGWNAIVFIAAIAGIEQEMYEAAKIDGAGRLRQIWSITIPSILPTIMLMLILRIGNLLTAGTEQILTMYSPVVYDVADVIGTYIYRIGLGKMEYSFSTAVGLFESVVGFALVITGNYLSRKFTDSSIW